MLFSLFLLVSLLLTVVESGPFFPKECRSFHQNSSRYDPLACWLLHLKVNIPDQSFSSGVFDLQLTDLQCTNFTLGGVRSAYHPSNFNTNQSDPSLQITAQNLSAICRGTYETVGLSGSMTARAVGRDHAVDLVLQVHSDNYSRPVCVNTTHCATELSVQDLQFSGSISAQLVNLFANTIQGYVSQALQDQLCPLFATTVDPLLDQWLDRLNAWLDRFVPRKKPIESVVASTTEESFRSRLTSETGGDTMNLQTEAPALVRSLEFLNQAVLAPHWNQGLLPHDWWNTNQTDSAADTCGFSFNGWNGVIRSALKEWYPEGLGLPLPPKNISLSLPDYGNVELQLHKLVFTSGLDQWEQLKVLQIQTPTELSTAMQTHNVTLRADCKLMVQPNGGTFEGDDLEELFSIHMNLSALHASLDLDVELNRSIVQNLEADTLMDIVHGMLHHNHNQTRQAANRLLQAVGSAQANQLVGHLDIASLSFVPQSYSGMALERDLDELLNRILQLVLNEYQSLVTDTLAAVARGPGRDKLNAFLQDHIANSTIDTDRMDGARKNTAAREKDEFFNFTEPLVRINRFFNQTEILRKVNGYVSCVSNLLAQIVEKRYPEIIGDEFLKIDTFELRDAGSVRKLQLLSPESNEEYLKTAIDYGQVAGQGEPRLAVIADLFLAPLNVTARLHLDMAFDDVSITGGSTLSYDSTMVRNMGILQLLQHGDCALAPASYIFHTVGSSLGSFEASLSAIVDSSEWDDAMNISFTSNEYPSIQRMASSLLDWSTSTVHDLAASATNAALDEAYANCNELPSPEDEMEGDGVDYASILLVIGVVCLFAQPGLLLIFQYRNISESSEAESEESGLEEPLLPTDPTAILATIEEEAEQSAASSDSPALMKSLGVSLFVRIAVPTLIVSTIVLLVSSNISVGATVEMVAILEDRVIRSPPLFAFSLFNTAKEMFQARIYPLFLLVVVFSGIWPYVKLLLLLSSWVAPESRLSVHRRGTLLLALDSLGKFSLVDTYVLVLMVVAFRYHLDLSSSQEGPFLEVFVTPQYGFYGFLAATTLSLLAGHTLVFYHRRASLSRERIEGSSKDTLFRHFFKIHGEERKLSGRFQFIIWATFAATVSLLAIGVTKESFIFEFGGLAGAMLGEKRRAAYSLLSLGVSISDSVEDPVSPGIIFLQVAYYFYAFITPFACLGLLAFLMSWPMTIKRQLFVLTLAEIANAWSAIEVFALSIVAALLEISTFASFIIGDRCSLLDRMLKDQDKIDVSTCYTVTSTVSNDGFFLIAAVLLNSAWVSVVLRLVHLALDERLEQDDSSSTDAPADSSSSFVERLAASRWTGWIISPGTGDLLMLDESEDSHLPDTPARSPHGDADEPEASSWQTPGSQHVFDDTWNESAERDPTFKQWKDSPIPRVDTAAPETPIRSTITPSSNYQTPTQIPSARSRYQTPSQGSPR